MQSEAGAAGTLHGAITKWRARHHVHRVAGSAAHAPEHVQDRGRALAGGHPRRGAIDRDARALDLRRPQRRHGRAHHGLGDARVGLGPGGRRPRGRCAHGALESRVPLLHFFDGFRTSHEIAKVAPAGDADVDCPPRRRLGGRPPATGLDPDRPVLRGSRPRTPTCSSRLARRPTRSYDAVARHRRGRVRPARGTRSGRRYGLVEYTGAPDAERVVVLMGSGVGAAVEAVDALRRRAARSVGPAPGSALPAVPRRRARRCPAADVRSPSRCSTGPRSRARPGEPLHLDVLAALADAASRACVRCRVSSVVGTACRRRSSRRRWCGRCSTRWQSSEPRDDFTVGIVDDVTHTSLPVDPSFTTDRPALRAVFYGLGSDGTVGANKQTVKIVGEHTDRHVQGYFVYDSKKSGSMTVSHLRFADAPIHSTYLISRCRLRGVSPVRSPRSCRRARRRRTRRDASC